MNVLEPSLLRKRKGEELAYLLKINQSRLALGPGEALFLL